jgi:hypothetical protein
MSIAEQNGITAMAGIASNLTLSSVLATLYTLKVQNPDEFQERYNQGVEDTIQVIKVYQNVLAAENRKLTNG